MKSLYLLLVLVLFTSCDPMQVLTVKTKEESTSITFYLKSNQVRGFEKVSNPLVVSSETNNNFSTIFLIGYWNNDNIQTDLTNNIDSIIIQTKKKKEFYKSPERIQHFLKKNHKTFSKNKIEIKR